MTHNLLINYYRSLMNDLEKELHKMLKPYGFILGYGYVCGISSEFEGLSIEIINDEICMLQTSYDYYHIDIGIYKSAEIINRLNLSDPKCFDKMIHIVKKHVAKYNI